MARQKGGKVEREPYTEVCVGEKALTVERAKELIGWEECDEKEEGCSPQIYSVLKKWVKLTKNRNRTLQVGWFLTLRQEHLRGRFKFNGESISLDTEGNVLSGQHRLLSFLLGWYEREEGEKAAEWKKFRPGPYVLPTVLCFNVPPDDATFQTLNSGRPATVSDVLYRSAEFVKVKDGGKRAKVIKAAQHAISFLWRRIGVGLDSWSTYQTISESMDFLQRHPRLLDACIHIVEEDAGKEGTERPSAVVGGSGRAAGLLYLMAASATDPEPYRKAMQSDVPPTEELLDLSRWDKACQFWVLSSGETKQGKIMYKASSLAIETSGGGAGALAGVVIACKAWGKFLDGVFDKTAPEDLLPEYGPENLNGRRAVVGNCALEGIDLGNIPADHEESERKDPPAPTPDQIAERTAALRAEKANDHPIPKRKIAR